MSAHESRRTGPSWKLAVVVIAVGVALAVPLVVRAVTSVADSVAAPAHRTPVTLRQNLEAGRYVVFERTGTTRQTGPFSATNQGPTTVPPSAVRVSGPSGGAVSTSLDQANETITKGSAIYTGAVVFDVPTDGRYEIEIAGDDTEVLVAPSLGQSFRRLGRVFGLAVFGGLVAMCGATLLIIGIVRRGRDDAPVLATTTNVTSSSAVPGWYPDPSGAPGGRYWDGDRWTEHTSK